MTYEIYRFLFIGGAAMCAVMLAATVILFFVLRIPNVIGDLTGANARKAIEMIRSQNEGTGEKVFKSSAVNRERGKITDKISATGRIMRRAAAPGGAMRTEKIRTDSLLHKTQEPQQYTAEGTTMLSYSESPETSLDGVYTDLNSYPVGETAALSQEGTTMYGQTVLLEQDEGQIFEVEFAISYIHSNVVIS